MSDVKACVHSVVKNAVTVVEQETGMDACCCSAKASFKFIFCPEIALGDLSVLTVMNSALAYVPDMQRREHFR
jgi:hypothetical protein